jgi:hypothetical protein
MNYTRTRIGLGCFRATGVTILLCLGGCSRAGHEEGAPPPPAPEVEPTPPEKAEATVRRIASRDDVALRGLRVDAKKGDWLLEGPGPKAGARQLAVVSTARGAIVDFGAVGGTTRSSGSFRRCSSGSTR